MSYSKRQVRKTFKYKAVVNKTTAALYDQPLFYCKPFYNLALERLILAYRQFLVRLNYHGKSDELSTLKKEFPAFAQIGDMASKKLSIKKSQFLGS